MRIAHLSDTHLGYGGQGIQQFVDDPWRPGVRVCQREADLMRSLAEAIDCMVGKICPDLVIHSGDLFDTPRPTAHILDFAMVQLKRLTAAGIPVVIVEGNHSCPRDRIHGHVLQLLAHIPGITVLCEGTEQFRFGNLRVHALPYQALLRGATPDRRAIDGAAINILVGHAVADGLDYFQMGRNAPNLAVRACASWYDFVALGHYHRFAQIPGTDRAFYAGSTAMVTWRDFYPGHQFGFSIVSLGGGAVVVQREHLDTRPMHAYGLDDATGYSSQEVLDVLGRQSDANPPKDACCQVVVKGLDPLTRKQLAMRDVEAIFDGAAALMIRLHVREQRWEAVRAGLLEGGDMVTRFAQLVEQSDGDAVFKAETLALGQEVLGRADDALGAEDIGAEHHEQASEP